MTDHPLRLSVVMATYNGARHLDEQLASLVAQQRLPAELVVSDDGSTDGTLEVIARFAATAPFPVRVHRQPVNLGPDQNFASAIALAEGDVVLCCDQDDRWHPEKLARMAAVLEADPAVGLVMCDGALVDDAMRPVGDTIWRRFRFDDALQAQAEGGDAFAVFARRMPVYGCTIALRASLRDRVLPIPPGPTFDSWIGQIAGVVSAVRLLPEPLIDYRQHSGQVTGFDGGSRLSRLRGMVTRSDATAVLAELVRLHAMEERLGTLPESAARSRALAVTRDRLHLADRRLAARRSPARRVPLIAAGLLRGEYSRGAQGLRSAAIDLVAPRDRSR